MEQDLGHDWNEIRGQLVVAVRKVCPAWLADRRDDLVQAATLNLLKNLKKYERDGPMPPSYLKRVAYNALVDEIRRWRRRREISLTDDQEEKPAMESPRPTPEARTLGGEIAVELRDCLGRLVPPRRRAVTLYLLGHSIPELLDFFGWTRKRAENLVYRGLANLRECLRDKGLEP